MWSGCSCSHKPKRKQTPLPPPHVERREKPNNPVKMLTKGFVLFSPQSREFHHLCHTTWWLLTLLKPRKRRNPSAQAAGGWAKLEPLQLRGDVCSACVFLAGKAFTSGADSRAPNLYTVLQGGTLASPGRSWLRKMWFYSSFHRGHFTDKNLFSLHL